MDPNKADKLAERVVRGVQKATGRKSHSEPSTRGPVSRVSVAEARQAAKRADGLYLWTITSYLALCSDTRDMQNTLSELKRNRPELFRRQRRR